ncbi:hypothetical protein [Dyella japonica]|uniref:Uncharacterized protein n=1 Tax=Dyella japonica TaxID=231455 RepID=A0ABV2JX63_9GAMM
MNPSEFRGTQNSGEHPPKSPNSTVAYAILGLMVEWYGGVMVTVPVIAALIIGFATYHWFGEARRILVFPFSVQAGQLIGLLAGFLAFGFKSPLFFNVFDVVLLAVCLVWLVLRPSNAPLYWLALYQAFGIVMNAVDLPVVSMGGDMSKMLIAATGIRLLTLAALFQARQTMSATKHPLATDAGA